MKTSTAKTALFCLLAVLIHSLHGQETEKTSPPPLVVETSILESQFVEGRNAEIRFWIKIRNDVDFELDGLKNLNSKFTIEEFNFTKPTPLPDSKDYNVIFGSITIKPNIGLDYGKYEIGSLYIKYSFSETIWFHDENNNEKLKEIRHDKTYPVPQIILEKAPLTISFVTNNGFQNVVNISEHLELSLKIFKEKNIEVLNYLPRQDLERLKLGNATNLDKPDLKPFILIKSEKTESEYEFYQEISHRYVLALYEVSLVKNFHIPEIHIFYKRQGDKVPKIEHLATPILTVKTNSVLTQNSNFRPLKDPLAPDEERRYRWGKLPYLTAKIMAGIAILLFFWSFLKNKCFAKLWSLLRFLAIVINKIRNKELGIFVKEKGDKLKNSLTKFLEPANKLAIICRWKTYYALRTFQKTPTQSNLITLIKAMRFYLGTIARINILLAQSFTTRELFVALSKRKPKLSEINALELAESLLDEEDITLDETNKITEQFRLLANNL